VKEYRRLADQKPLTLQVADFAQAVQDLNKAIDRSEGLLHFALNQGAFNWG
jgi:hypothetical protein